MLTYKQNLKAILDSHLTEVKDEIKDSIIDNILSLKIEQEPTIGQGHWIKVNEVNDFGADDTFHFKCSTCGSTQSGWGYYRHCPNCGTKMEGVEWDDL